MVSGTCRFIEFDGKRANAKRRLMGEICPKIPNGYLINKVFFYSLAERASRSIF